MFCQLSNTTRKRTQQVAKATSSLYLQALYLHQRMMPRFQRDFISDLPREIALRILGYLYPEELLRIASTCKYWSVITSDNNLWREKCRERGLTRFFSYMRHKRDLDSIPKTIYYKVSVMIVRIYCSFTCQLQVIECQLSLKARIRSIFSSVERKLKLVCRGFTQDMTVSRTYFYCFLVQYQVGS